MQVIFQQWQSKISRLSWFTMDLSFNRLQNSQHWHNVLMCSWTSAKDIAYFERTSAVSGTKHFNFHTLQAPFSPKAFHRSAEDTISKRRGWDPSRTSFSSVLVIKGSGPCIRRKKKIKLLPIQKFHTIRTEKYWLVMSLQKLGKLTWTENQFEACVSLLKKQWSRKNIKVFACLVKGWHFTKTPSDLNSEQYLRGLWGRSSKLMLPYRESRDS